MNIEDIETNIVTKLSGDITGVKIEAFPDDPADYELTHPKGAILVRYDGDSYSDPEGPTVIKQDRTVSVEITVLTRNLRTHTGVYSKLDAIKTSLKGYQVDSKYGAMYPSSVSYVDFINGIWQWAFVFEFEGKELNQ